MPANFEIGCYVITTGYFQVILKFPFHSTSPKNFLQRTLYSPLSNFRLLLGRQGWASFPLSLNLSYPS